MQDNQGHTNGALAQAAKDVIKESNNNSDLQRAIELSLKDQTYGNVNWHITAEEEDISRVLEQDIAERKAQNRDITPNADPREWKREGSWPVGLKNVGNTCWFSAVIQSLFNIPKFRNLVIKFRIQQEDIYLKKGKSFSSSKHRNLVFMRELRNLFGLLVASKRKYVDPSKALDILKEAFEGPTSDNQQDVSEFTHKLLEWMEDAFQSQTKNEGESSVEKDIGNEKQDESYNLPYLQTSNPLVSLFYGQYRSEGFTEGRAFTNVELFGQYPLQVNGFCDIHDSLEASVCNEIINSSSRMPVGSADNKQSGQEHWFTALPPVLLFELLRFQFNQQTGKPEKIHNKFEFPDKIYMDRYLEYNKHLIRSKREYVNTLKQKKQILQAKLDQYLNYGSGKKKIPLQDVIQYTLDFVESGDPVDVCLTLGDDSLANLQLDSRAPVGEGSEVMVSAEDSLESQCLSDQVNMRPRNMSSVQRKVLTNSLNQWKEEVENDVEKLLQCIHQMEVEIKEMYEQEALMKVPYQLHAVLVHGGQAASGHYWAYVYCSRRNMWLKFNDISVSETSWTDLFRESAGGFNNASAYCLIYINWERSELIDVGSDDFLINTFGALPEDLQEYIKEDNNALEKEIVDWEKSLRSKVGQESGCKDIDQELHYLMMRNSQFVVYRSIRALGEAKGECSQKGITIKDHPMKALNIAIAFEHKSIQNMLKVSSITDARVESIVAYLMINGAQFYHVIWALVHQFAHPALCTDRRSEVIQCQAADELEHLKKKHTLEQKKLHYQWLKAYEEFRRLIGYFCQAIELYSSKEFTESLMYLVPVCILNNKLVQSHPYGPHKGLEPQMLFKFLRISLMHVSDKCCEVFNTQSREKFRKIAEIMLHILEPAVRLVSQSENNQSSKLLEDIRSKWCSLLGEELSSDKQKVLQHFLSLLLDPFYEGQELSFECLVDNLEVSDDFLTGRFAMALKSVHEEGQSSMSY